MNYFDDPLHLSLRAHYVGNDGGGVALVFSERWSKDNLPAFNDFSDMLAVVLADTHDGGKEYACRTVCSVDGPDPAWVMDFDWNEPPLCQLQSYFYSYHYCDCHRKRDALRAGADTDEDCERVKRFSISRIFSPKQPGLILYSETIGKAELEDRLRKEDGRCAMRSPTR